MSATTTPPAGLLARRRRRILAVSLALACAVAILLAVMLGARFIGFDDLLAIWRGNSIGGVEFIVLENRLPNAVSGLLAGFALGCAGALFQSLLRNPLASPDIIGVSLGGSAAAVVGMVFWRWQGGEVVAAAFVGALAVAVGIYLASHRAHDTGGALVLTGIAVAALLQAVVAHTMTRAHSQVAGDVYRWMAGSLNDSTWPQVLLLVVGLLVLLPVVGLAGHRLRLLELGDDAASALGVHVERTRLLLVVVGAALCALAVAVTGPLAFVSFLAGPAARLLNRGRTSLLLAGLCGGLLVVLAETVAHSAFGKTSLPVGIITGALGAPALVFMLTRSRRV